MQHSLFTLILAESAGISDDVYPFSVMHCSWELRYGGRRIFEVFRDSLPEFSLRFAGRDLQKRAFLEQEQIVPEVLTSQSTPIMILRSEIAPNTHTVTILRRMAIDGAQSFIIKDANRIIGVYLVQDSELSWIDLNAPTFEQMISQVPIDALPVTIIESESLNHMWDAMMATPKAIAESFGYFSKHLKESLPGHVFALNVDRILIGRNCVIAPGVVLDASNGPIIIESDAQIMAQAFVQGPCHIGKGSIIKAGAQIYSGTVLGPLCKIGGEVEQSIFHGYANKQHQGFVGHTYCGEWVNLGAMTTTSDLKNTYGDIDVFLRGKKVQTGLKFLGSLIGDHTKTAIGTCLSTGTVIGINTSLHDIGEFPPKEIPSFSWGTKKSTRYELDKALNLADLVMKRRGKNITSIQKQLFSQEFEKH
jgi:UDP-N-acetylglucosamine diphosphorylase/glucosamine-1-phosphate N-acetyltransferase